MPRFIARGRGYVWFVRVYKIPRSGIPDTSNAGCATLLMVFGLCNSAGLRAALGTNCGADGLTQCRRSSLWHKVVLTTFCPRGLLRVAPMVSLDPPNSDRLLPCFRNSHVRNSHNGSNPRYHSFDTQPRKHADATSQSLDSV